VYEIKLQARNSTDDGPLSAAQNGTVAAGGQKPKTKIQIRSKHQDPNKHQAPNTKLQTPSSKHQGARIEVWNLVFGAYLDLGS
jgi:hypothetical protein